MNGIAAIVTQIGLAAPGLSILSEDRGDMLDTEQWGAVLSAPDEDGESTYRYALWRVWSDSLPLLLVIMLNPSTADHLADDRTIAGLVRRARRLGYGGILVVNCFAFRAKEPPDMKKASDPVGPENDAILALVLSHDVDLLCAWGANAVHLGREREVRCAISSGRARPHALRLCAGGAPEHPLYIPGAVAPEPWDPISTID